MGYKLAGLTYAGDQAGNRWPLYALTKNITYNNLNPYFSPEYYGWGKELRPVFQNQPHECSREEGTAAFLPDV